MYARFTALGRHYLSNNSGQFAIMIALLGLPLLLICGYAVDINKASSKKNSISAALDAAALASVIPANLTNIEREAFARQVFEENYFGDIPVVLDIAATKEQVAITGSSHVSTLVGGVIGIDGVAVKDKSIAVLTRSDVVCVLALDPSGERSIEFKDQARFYSPACSVQVNSTHELAMVSDVVEPPVASSFCVGGISRGEFLPYVKHACTPVIDPYENISAPEDGPCMDVSKLKGDNTAVSVLGEVTDAIGSDAELEPGTYCKGLEIQGVNIRFKPGVYIIKKDLRFKQFAAAVGENVTFVLKGDKSTLHIEGGSQVNLKAPAQGVFAGLVFYQTLDKQLGVKTKYPSAISEIKSGGGLSLVGTAYFPTQELIISSESPVVSQSPATSFIAYRLKFAGKSNTQVHVDHEAGGIPPMLPRSDDGARLVTKEMFSALPAGDDD